MDGADMKYRLGKMKPLLIHLKQEISMNTAITDLLRLLHEEWLPEDRKEVIKEMLVSMIDKMDDSSHLEDMR
jgi:hypothetical protein